MRRGRKEGYQLFALHFAWRPPAHTTVEHRWAKGPDWVPCLRIWCSVFEQIFCLVALIVKTSLWAKWMSHFRNWRVAHYQCCVFLHGKWCQEKLKGPEVLDPDAGFGCCPQVWGDVVLGGKHWVLSCSLVLRCPGSQSLAEMACLAVKHFMQMHAWLCQHWEN